MAASMGSLLRNQFSTAARCCSQVPAPRLAAPMARFLPLLATPQQRLFASKASKGQKQPAPIEPEIMQDDEEEGEFMNMELTAPMQRRVQALRDVQDKYDAVMADYQKDIAALQAKYLERYNPVFDERRDIITGKVDVPKYDIEDDGAEDTKNLPDFWLNALMNNEELSGFITERDAEVLKFLEDIRYETLPDGATGFKLHFHFAQNPHFSNQVLTKTYVLEPESDVVPKEFIGCKIDWKSPAMDVTVERKKKRVKSAKGGKPTFESENVPCTSFFNFFDPPAIPKDANTMADEELDALQEDLSRDFDMGYAIKDAIIPRAVEWYTGELSQSEYENEDDMDYDFEEEEEEVNEPPARSQRRK